MTRFCEGLMGALRVFKLSTMSPQFASVALVIGMAFPEQLRDPWTETVAAFPLAEASTFSSWRPYSNPNRLVQTGMNKGEVLAIAGKPDYEESYYQSSPGRLIRISDWYYVRTGVNPETTILKFVAENLVSISSSPTR